MRRHPPFLDIEMEIHTGNIPEGRAGTVAAVHIADVMRGYGFGKDTVFTVFAGNGGNGRDGIEAASVFSSKGFRCEVVRLEDAGAYLEAHSGRKAGHEEIYIDALLGADEYADFKGAAHALAGYINDSGAFVISLGIPSGMPPEPFDETAAPDDMVRADVTVAIDFPKLSMLLPRYGNNAGRIVTAVSETCCRKSSGKYFYVDNDAYNETVSLEPCLGRPKKFAHKGDNGHLLVVCGCKGMTGAAVLATKAALRSGCGIVTSHLPESERAIMHVSCPSAIVSLDDGDCFTMLPDDMDKYTAVCTGCGLGKDRRTVKALASLLACGKPTVIDADALNLISASPELKSLVPAGSVLTPHLGELRRLTGGWEGEEEKLEKAAALAASLSSVVVVKGAHTMTVSPDGRAFFNSTGTPGMAKGGCGDVLAGYIGGLLARGCSPLSAAIVGVYRHGAAGERAEAVFGSEAMNSSDVVSFLKS